MLPFASIFFHVLFPWSFIPFISFSFWLTFTCSKTQLRWHHLQEALPASPTLSWVSLHCADSLPWTWVSEPLANCITSSPYLLFKDRDPPSVSLHPDSELGIWQTAEAYHLVNKRMNWTIISSDDPPNLDPEPWTPLTVLYFQPKAVHIYFGIPLSPQNSNT